MRRTLAASRVVVNEIGAEQPMSVDETSELLCGAMEIG